MQPDCIHARNQVGNQLPRVILGSDKVEHVWDFPFFEFDVVVDKVVHFAMKLNEKPVFASNVGGVRGALLTVFSDAEFMQGVFTAIEQVVRNTVQTMQVPIRAVDSRATTAIKAFLQLRPPTFRDEPDPLDAEDWLKQVTKALDTILVMEEELRCCLRHTNCKGTHSNGGRPWRKVWLKSVNRLRKPF